MRYALLIYSPSDARGYAAPASGAINEMVAYARAARNAGVLVAAEQLTHTDSATSVRVRGGDRLLTDGPFMETKEHLLGFFLLDVPDLDTALEWAARLPPAAYGTVEVQAAQTGQPWQAVLDCPRPGAAGHARSSGEHVWARPTWSMPTRRNG